MTTPHFPSSAPLSLVSNETPRPGVKPNRARDEGVSAGDQIEVTITYLEQSARPQLVTQTPPALARRKSALMRVEHCPVHFYRYMYDLVGAPYNWVSRRKLSDDALTAIIHSERTFLYVLYVDGAPAGFTEIDAKTEGVHEIKFFGLTPEFIGVGLGRYFFANILDIAWARAPKIIKLETCTLDHPAALAFYQKFGFAVADRRNGYVERWRNQTGAAHLSSEANSAPAPEQKT